ncbi:hypothetical protein AZE42_04092 [Rhizopogon vesiculosus]|uniref:Uncharacterized protein n=1 Tax=Rhizopogon vesiculosus TaxID=180088 RepID=A0A1J8R3A4_9AGAM|nr:hypothetical protein AZE42_04092 [Rhizopogon vesiculosus]
MTWGVPYWTVSSSSTARPVLTTQASARTATLAEHRAEWEEVSPVCDDHDADIVSLDGSKTYEDMRVLHLQKLLDEAKQENGCFEEQVQSLLNQSMTETSSLQAKIAELRQRNKEALTESERTKKEKEDVAAALTKKNDVLKATLQQQSQEMRQALEELTRSTAQAQAELQDAKSSVLECRRQLSQSSAQVESLRKEQIARMSLTDRVAALDAELKAKDTELAELRKLSLQSKSANVAREESTALMQEFTHLRSLLVNCVPERPTSVVNTGVMSSSSEVVSALRKLNSDILQDATFMAESMTESFGFGKGGTMGDEEAIFQQVGMTLGAGLVHFLSTKDHSDPILIQIAFQALISQYLCWLSTAWIAGGDKEILGTTDQNGTSKHYPGLRDQFTDSSAAQTVSTAWSALKFSQKISLLAKTGLRINRLIGNSGDRGLDVVVIKPATAFDSACMDDAYDDGDHDKDIANNLVLCPTDIGLCQRSKGVNAGLRILLKPKIALESVVDNLDD